ncbi:MAG TPA: polyribonucleotide nucleotidyltransferase [Ignavibacteria bacterium]|nr:polyribonucleotide nucleotidyltransferase [Bacteroidota bacterium]HRI85452.1 polyribonucleotide nucleotidyltransferase [Ignavibacteria bacterium]HRJ98788.1 polyribonucleotide nucleotidyltransferase [Ignavibacteria bacterium]
MTITKSIEIGGRKLTLESGKLAKQANGAVWISVDDNYVLCTVTAADTAKPGQDFFPLTVDYREKTASAGKIPGGFFKREGRPTEKEILSSRLIDRPIRPMFPEGFFNEVQLLCSVYSSDGEYDADVIAATGGSAALLISDIPFDTPISEVRVTRINGEFILNPTHRQIEEGDFDITIAGTVDSIMMVEGEAKEISESEIIEAIKFGHKFIAQLCGFQLEFAAECGKAKRELLPEEDDSEITAEVTALCAEDIKTVTHTILTKEERSFKNREIFDKAVNALIEKYPEQEKKIGNIIHDIQYDILRAMVLDGSKRLDGRGLKDIRNITCEVGILPRTHGSALFTRGQTQSLTTVTLGTKRDEQMIEGLKEMTTKRFMLHYNFPPFSTGEVGGRPGPGRREIGHGNLAERALKNLLPGEEEFPYSIRIVSDILESNGSSSMATVCAGSLALMDAGVKLKKPVAGIAMGLIKENDKVAILSDILGDEDHFGDMDFKVAGTADGITAIQMDIKIRGISFEVMERALEQAKEGRLHILNVMSGTLTTARESISRYAPHLYSMTVPREMIGAVIGPGGKTIRSIIAESGAEIDIDDEGKVTIAAVDHTQAEIARKMIAGLTEVPEIGKIYDGTVKGIKDFGAFVEILPGKEGLLHISEIDNKRVLKVEDVLKFGQKVQVKLLGIDDSGKLKLSRKILLPKESAPAKPKENAK